MVAGLCNQSFFSFNNFRKTLQPSEFVRGIRLGRWVAVRLPVTQEVADSTLVAAAKITS